MKNKIIEIIEIGHPQSLIQRENAPISELIKTDFLVEELNEQLKPQQKEILTVKKYKL